MHAWTDRRNCAIIVERIGIERAYDENPPIRYLAPIGAGRRIVRNARVAGRGSGAEPGYA